VRKTVGEHGSKESLTKMPAGYNSYVIYTHLCNPCKSTYTGKMICVKKHHLFELMVIYYL